MENIKGVMHVAWERLLCDITCSLMSRMCASHATIVAITLVLMLDLGHLTECPSSHTPFNRLKISMVKKLRIVVLSHVLGAVLPAVCCTAAAKSPIVSIINTQQSKTRESSCLICLLSFAQSSMNSA